MRAQGWLEPNIFAPLHLNIVDAFAGTSQNQDGNRPGSGLCQDSLGWPESGGCAAMVR